MTRTRQGHSGRIRGEASPEKFKVSVTLDSEAALNLIRHVAEALTYSDKVVVEPHWGRRGSEGNVIYVWSA